MANYYTTTNKQHNKNGITFDALSLEGFDTVNIAASQADTTVQAIVPLAQDVKLEHVSIGCISITGACTIEVVYGAATPGAVGTPNVAAVNGTSVFSAPVSVPAAGVTTVVNVPVPDVPYPKGGQLTLRATTAAANTVTGLKVCLAVKAVDPNASSSALPTPAGNYKQADPSNF